MILSLIIAVLMSLGLVNSTEDYNSRSAAEQQELQEIIITDYIEN